MNDWVITSLLLAAIAAIPGAMVLDLYLQSRRRKSAHDAVPPEVREDAHE